MKENNYRWIICLACTVALFCDGGLLVTGFSVYTPYLISEGGLTNADTSMVIMVRNLFTLLSMFAVVPVIRKVDIRVNLSVSVLLGAAALLLCSVSRGVFMFGAAMALAGMAYGLGGMVSVSVIIKRWFTTHEGLALGICAAGTGLSTVIGSPVITSLIENRSMASAMRMEAVFLACAAALVFLLVRNYPSREKEEQVLRERQKKISRRNRGEVFPLSKAEKVCLFAGVFLCGMTQNASAFVTVLFREKGFDAASVGWLVSLMGLTLCAGKCVYGAAADRLGRVRAGNLFYACFVLGMGLCAVCFFGNTAMAVTAMALLGAGFPMLSVGISELAAGTSARMYYADAVRELQTAYMLGTVVFATVPGNVADITGSYVPSYYILTVTALIAALLQQGLLMKEEKRKQPETAE